MTLTVWGLKLPLKYLRNTSVYNGLAPRGRTGSHFTQMGWFSPILAEFTKFHQISRNSPRFSYFRAFCCFVDFGPPGGARGGARMGPHLAPPRESPKSRNVKKPLVLTTTLLSFTQHYIVKRGPRRGRAGARPGAKSRPPIFALSADFLGFHDFNQFQWNLIEFQ